jgi:peptidylprolyl isomerase
VGVPIFNKLILKSGKQMIKKALSLIFSGLIVFGLLDLEAKQQKNEPRKYTIAHIETNYGSVEIILFPEVAPKATENFISLAKNGSYDNCPFHRIIPDGWIQTGDCSKAGGQSIWGATFEDEFSDNVLFDAPGRLAMANKGPNTNATQFFITTVATPWLHKRHSIFGQVIKGLDTVKKIESLGSGKGYFSQPWFGKKREEPKIIKIEIV